MANRNWRDGMLGAKDDDPSLPGIWEQDDSEYPVSDWRREVFDGDTMLGYADWVANRREFADD